VSAEDTLLPGAGVSGVDVCLERQCHSQAAPEHLLLVSHQPLVSRLVDHYLGERGRVPPLSPGGFATLSLEAPVAACARLLFWALPPTYKTCA
jgi:phosphohistidine phosphatase